MGSDDLRERAARALRDASSLLDDDDSNRLADAVLDALGLERYAAVHTAAVFLLALKDGPRDDFYAATKEHAWQMLRDALAAAPSSSEGVGDG